MHKEFFLKRGHGSKGKGKGKKKKKEKKKKTFELDFRGIVLQAGFIKS